MHQHKGIVKGLYILFYMLRQYHHMLWGLGTSRHNQFLLNAVYLGSDDDTEGIGDDEVDDIDPPLFTGAQVLSIGTLSSKDTHFLFMVFIDISIMLSN